ncbi:MAG: hypothetical protein ACE5L6_02750 [Candidatus Bathyarchaeia archaeon]
MSIGNKMRWIRVLVFAAIYFLIYVFSAVYFMVRTYSGTSELTWYLQHPWIALHTIFGELIRSPLLMLSLFLMMLQSFILGFVTDWALRTIRKHIRLKKRNPKI